MKKAVLLLTEFFGALLLVFSFDGTISNETMFILGYIIMVTSKHEMGYIKGIKQNKE
jgi:hypothetical protein